jgi:hypothetical protein
MENSIDCTKMHGSSKRSILCPSEKESYMGSNTSSGTDGHVQWRRKRTEAQTFKNHAAIITKIPKSTVKNGRLHYFFSPILFRLLLYITLQWGLLLLVVFCH